MLNIFYTTMRKEPHIEWFFESLHVQCNGDYSGMRVGVIDFWIEEPGRRDRFAKAFRGNIELIHRSPMPSVWQGPHRLSKKNYYDFVSAKNTGICLSEDGCVVLVDDLSILMPGWLKAVREAESGGYIGCGAYRKVCAMQVMDGVLMSYKDHPQGPDHRWDSGSDAGPVPCIGGWLFGCTIVAPLEALLDINGFDMDSTPHGGADCLAGVMLEKRGYKLMYDRRILTYESIEGHVIDPTSPDALLRLNEVIPGRLDRGLELVERVVGTRDRAPNEHYGPGGIAQLRLRALINGSFPVFNQPDRSWYSGKLVSEF